jgi:hypothetical protein
MISDNRTLHRLLQKRDDLFRRIPKSPVVIRGCLVEMKRVCGKSGCRCLKKSPHKSLYISQSIKGKTRMIYVPRSSEDAVRRGILEYRRMKNILKELAAVHLELLSGGRL